MPEAARVAKAELAELDPQFADRLTGGRSTKVQFNPDSLKVTFANQIQQPQGGGDQSGPQAQQFVGAGSTKLAVQLWFDVTQELGELPETMDVRELTQRVAYFITPKGDPPSNPKRFLPPGVRFSWGTFRFDGIMESMEETLELFSAEGRPLRASVAITVTQQKITGYGFATDALLPPGFPARVGTTPQIEAPAGSTLQALASSPQSGGGGRDWQSIAAANGIENPRLLEPGQRIDFQATKSRLLTG